MIFDKGVLARALPVWPVEDMDQHLAVPDIVLAAPEEITHRWPSAPMGPFRESGVMWKGQVWTRKVIPNFDSKFLNLGDVLIPDDEVPESFFIPDDQLSRWKYLKGPKSEERTAKNGHRYRYQEGGIRTPTRPIDHQGPSSPAKEARPLRASSTSSRRATGATETHADRTRTPQWLPRRLDQHRDARRETSLHDGQRLGRWGCGAGRARAEGFSLARTAEDLRNEILVQPEALLRYLADFRRCIGVACIPCVRPHVQGSCI